MTKKSKREIEREIEQMESGPPGEYRQITLVELLSYDLEPISELHDLYRIEDTGEVVYHPKEEFEELLSDDDADD